MDNNSKALKSGFWYIFSNLVVRGMTLITTPVFSRLLTHEQFGDYSNYQSWSSIALMVITMRMESSLISAKFDFKDDLARYDRSIVALTLVMTTIWAAVIHLFSGAFVGRTGLSLFYLDTILVYCLFQAIVNLFQMMERYAYRYKQSVLIAMTVAISTALVSIALVVLLEDKLTGRILGGVIPVALVGFVLLLLLFKGEKSVNPAYWPYTLRICIPYIPHLLSLQVLNTVDRIMITRICGAADNALYSIAYLCGNMITILITSLNSAFSPWLGDKINSGEREEIKKVSRYYILLFTVFATGMMLLAPEILLIMGGKSYLEARYVMTPVAMGCVCQFIYTLYVNVEQYKKKTVMMAFASMVAALLNYGLNAYFIPRYGYIAAAYTTLAGYLALLFMHMAIVYHIGEGDNFDHRFVVALLCAMGLITAGINFLYGNQMLRYIVLVIYILILGAAAYVKRDIVTKLLKKIIK